MRRPGPGSILAVGGSVLALAGAIYAQGRLVEGIRRSTAVRTELALQQSELQECRDRLHRFYLAWERYQLDHHHEEPPSIAALVPKYLPDPHVFVCPTGLRLLKQGRQVERGTYRYGRRLYPWTYSFAFLSPGDRVRVRRLGDRAPLVLCLTHREAAYRAAYRKPVPLSASDPAARRAWLPEVASAPVPIVRRDGQLDLASPGDE